jgi:hypothetical protein
VLFCLKCQLWKSSEDFQLKEPAIAFIIIGNKSNTTKDQNNGTSYGLWQLAAVK